MTVCWFSDIKKALTIYFHHIDSEQLMHMLSTIDKIHIRFLQEKLEDIEELTEDLGEKIFQLFKQKMIDEHEETVSKSDIIYRPVKIHKH